MIDRIYMSLGWLIAALYLTFPKAYALSNILLALLVLMFVLTFRREHFTRAKWTPTLLLMLALYVWMMTGLIYTPAPWEWVSRDLGKVTYFLYVLPVGLLLMGQPLWQKRALNAFMLGMGFVMVSTWLNIWFVLPWSSSQTTGWGVSHHVMYDYIIQNVMMTLFVVMCLVKMRQPQTKGWPRMIWLLLAVMGAISITHLSQGRTGLALLVPALLAFASISLGWRKTLVATPILGIVVALGVMSSPVMQSRIAQGTNEFQNRYVDVFSSIGHRLYNWRTTPQLIAEKPIIGHGLGAYHTEICRHLEKPEWCDTFRWHPHQQFLLFAANHGLIGVLLYVGLLTSLVMVALRSTHTEPRTLLLTLVVMLVADSMINSPLFSSRTAEFYLYMMVLLVAMCREPADGRCMDKPLQ